MPVLTALATFITATAIPAVVSFGAALLANPIGLVTAAIAALILAGVALVKNWDTIKKWASKVWGAISWGVGQAVDFISKQIRSLIDLVPDWMLKIIQFANPVGGAVAIANAIRGREVGGARVDTTVAPGGGAASATVGGKVTVDFKNAPEGTEIRTSDSGDIPLDVETGVNLAGAGA